MKYIKKAILLISILLFTACDSSVMESEKDTPVSPKDTNILQKSELFVETESDIYTIETNDFSYLTSSGYTLWSVEEINTTDNFTPLNITVCKISGQKEAGFGIVFCIQQLEDKPFLLTVLINSNGLYTIGKVCNGIFSHINEGWKNSNYINKGYGISNEINVSYNIENKKFILKINGYEITSFAVSENIKFKNSSWGFAAVIANNENFPSIPVKIIYEK